MSWFTKWASASILAGVLLMAHPGTCAAQQKGENSSEHQANYYYDTPGVRLEGTLIKRKVYGPPGDGETPAQDVRTAILVLRLAHPICVEPVANADASKTANLDPAKNVRDVQLFVSVSRRTDARKLVGRVVTATGTLNESITASQYTKVWLEAKTLEPE
ncbi:MAG TPA: hypothetical protein VFQ00_13795 [Terriglobales bacterium]|nr:hypothetical protein [Terriglobales bacterium]